MAKTFYDSPQGLFKAWPTDQDLIYDVYNVNTNLKVGVIDAEDGKIKFTDPHAYLSVSQLNDIKELVNGLFEKFNCNPEY